MSNQIIEKIRSAGIVGAGGAGFPTHVKINNKAEIVIGNGAECEPLLRVDQQVMEHYSYQIIRGMEAVMEVTQAKQGVICLKAKYKQAVVKLKAAAQLSKFPIEVKLIDNYYPAGDEQQMVFEVIGRVVPVGGLPIDVGAVVVNVTTLMNISDALEDKPVTHKYVTVTGEVRHPVTVNAPLGLSIRRLIEMAGGPAESPAFSIVLGGPAMGKVEANWDAPVTKTLGGVLVLPSDHPVVLVKSASLDKQIRMSKAVCCQCNYCTELCPRAASGLGTAPHKAMRAVAYGDGSALSPENILSCCDCGICTFYACPMGLLPSRIMTAIKGEMQKKRVPYVKAVPFNVDPARDYKKIPVHRFMARLNVSQYDLPAPIEHTPVPAQVVRIPLKQHIGNPCQPVVAVGDTVSFGQLIAEVGAKHLGAPVHASIAGRIESIEGGLVTILA